METMDGQARREHILARVSQTDTPVSAAALARELGVSRQVIVGDVALLRAGGHPISATPRGYLAGKEPGLTRTLACVHPAEGMAAELYALVDAGCEVVDVIVEHPVYGQLTGLLRVRSRFEVDQFLEKVAQADARPLSDLTEGIHLHTVRAPDPACFQRAEEALRALGYLLE